MLKLTQFDHCKNARTSLIEMQRTIAQALGASSAKQACKDLSADYIRNTKKISKDKYGSAPNVEKMAFLEECLAEAVLQLNAMNEVGAQAKEQGGQDFMKMVRVEKLVVRL